MFEVTSETKNEGTKWSFIPPRAPHFGGLWEAALKSFKYHLKRVVGDSTLTYEELSTVTTMIEACLNLRPLCAISGESSELIPLTSGHFLVGSSLLSIPEPYDEQELNKTFKCKRKYLLAMRNNFWNRWKKEVLNQLQQYNKWFDSDRNLVVGDLIILEDELSPPLKWPMARVVKVYEGTDNLIRVVKLETANKTRFTRSVDRLIPLIVSIE